MHELLCRPARALAGVCARQRLPARMTLLLSNGVAGPIQIGWADPSKPSLT